MIDLGHVCLSGATHCAGSGQSKTNSSIQLPQLQCTTRWSVEQPDPELQSQQSSRTSLRCCTFGHRTRARNRQEIPTVWLVPIWLTSPSEFVFRFVYVVSSLSSCTVWLSSRPCHTWSALPPNLDDLTDDWWINCFYYSPHDKVKSGSAGVLLPNLETKVSMLCARLNKYQSANKWGR